MHPQDADPLHVPEDDIERDARRAGCVVGWIGLALLVWAVVIGLIFAASSSAHDGSPRHGQSGAPPPGVAQLAEHRTADRRYGGRGFVSRPRLAGAPLSGTATWYCGSGSPCTRGYDPGDLIAAIDRKDTPWDKGDRLVVTSGDSSVTVRIVDVCGCPGRRVIDLSAEAFSRLAPLGRGVIPVTIREVPALPETSTEPRREHR